MTAFIFTRFAQSVLVLFIMSLLVFGGVNLVGDPVEMLINPEADQAEVERVIRELGLDRPVTEQYWYFTTISMINFSQNLIAKRDNGENLSQKHIEFLRKHPLKMLEKSYSKIQKERRKVSDHKEAQYTKLQKARKELNRAKKESKGNVVTTRDDGQHIVRLHSAPLGEEMSLTRVKSDILRDVAKKLCITENILKLDYEDMITLVRELRESTYDDPRWNQITLKLLEVMEKNKETLTRETLLELCNPLLTLKLQETKKLAVYNILKNPAQKKELTLSATRIKRNEEIRLLGLSKRVKEQKLAIADFNRQKNFEKTRKTSRFDRQSRARRQNGGRTRGSNDKRRRSFTGNRTSNRQSYRRQGGRQSYRKTNNSRRSNNGSRDTRRTQKTRKGDQTNDKGKEDSKE